MPRGIDPGRRELYRRRKLARLEGNRDDQNWSSSSSSSDGDENRPRRQRIPEDFGNEDQGDEEGGSSSSASSGGHEEENDSDNLQSESGGEPNEVSDDAHQDNVDADNVIEEDGEQENDDNLPQEENHSSSSGESTASSGSEESEESSDEEEYSSEDSEQEGHVEVDNGDVPIYPTARITILESLIMMLTLSLRFSLTGECISYILEMIEMHCPAGNLCKTSLFKFKNFFVEIGRKALVLHYFCEHCMSELEGKNSVCGRCNDNTVVAFFIEIPLLFQLQKLFLRDGFVESLMYRFNRIKKHPDNYEDLYDGALYKEQMANGFLSSRNNISFTWYSDGIQIFKSSKYSVWPLFLCINELSYKLRTQKENILLCGLWFGKSKPRPNLFLKPFRETFETFKNEGYRFNVPNGGSILVKALLLCGTCDLQAKSLFLRTKLYNGYYGCCVCYSQGERAAAGRTTVGVHPYTAPRNVRLRKNGDVLKCARIARQRGKKSHLGIKGVSLLFYMMPNMIRGTGVDIMHQVFLGICKLLSKFWFDPKFSDEPFSCSAMQHIVNERLKSIYPPSFVQRQGLSQT